MKNNEYRPDIDGLRAVAVMLVVIYHAFPERLQGGFIGVDVFFVISGYLITKIIYSDLRSQKFSIRRFYIKRILRIFPGLILVLSSCAAFGWFVLTAEELRQLGKHIIGGAAFVANFIYWSEVDYFDVSAEFKPLLHLWSLGVEEQFYLIWPLVFVILFKQRTGLFLVTTMIISASLILSAVLTFTYPTAAFFFPFTRAWELLLGAILAIYGNSIEGKGGRDQAKIPEIMNFAARNAYFLSWLGIGLILIAAFFVNEDKKFPGFWAVLPAFGAFLIILAGDKSKLNKKFLSAKPVVWVGLISYPLYLWHWPILSFGYIVNMGLPHRDFRIGAVLLSIILAWLTYKFIESPFRSSSNASIRKVKFLLGCFLLLLVIGGFLVSNDFSKSHSLEKLSIQRVGAEYFVNGSNTWYEGTDGWLFLGNRYQDTIKKLRLSKPPSDLEVSAIVSQFATVASAAESVGAQMALLVGSNKSSVYSEYLPSSVVPSSIRYVDYFLRELRAVNNLILIDPTLELIEESRKIGFLFWRTDTHWNRRGGYVAYRALMEALGYEAITVNFLPGEGYFGDLIEISGLQNYTLRKDDDWSPVFDRPRSWEEILNSIGEVNNAFGKKQIVVNSEAVVEKHIWVVGDSFTNGLRDYLNATFSRVEYLGHWHEEFQNIPSLLEQAHKVPDLILVVRVERSF